MSGQSLIIIPKIKGQSQEEDSKVWLFRGR